VKKGFLKDLALLKNKKIGLIAGGISSERAIALKSSAAVEKALKSLGLNYIYIDFNPKNRKDIFSVIRKARLDIVFLGLHGSYGEDGRIQGALDIMGIKYTGSGVLASSIGMDKLISKKLLLEAGLPTPDYYEYTGKELKMTLPVVVKPVDGGSTIGVTIVKSRKDFQKAVRLAKKYCAKVMVEKYIQGREVTVPVLFDRALPVIEIIPKTAFYDYTAKYTKGMSDHILPAKLKKSLYAGISELAVLTHKLLLMKDYSRIDFMIEEKSGKPYILEANSLPGLTGTSLLPEAAKCAGLSFEELILKMLAGGLRNAQ